MTTAIEIANGATYVPRVTLYTADKPARTVELHEALTAVESGTAVLVLGRMREGYLGREMVTADDLRRWIHEDESAAEWAAIEAGERAMDEIGLLR